VISGSNASGRSALTASIQTTSDSLSGYYCRNSHGAPLPESLRQNPFARPRQISKHFRPGVTPLSLRSVTVC
jgi:hypothetical protein